MRFCLWLVLITILTFTARAQAVEVLYSDGRPTEEISSRQVAGSIVVSADDIARLLNLDSTWDRNLKRMTLTGEGHKLEILAGPVSGSLTGEQSLLVVLLCLKTIGSLLVLRLQRR